jgi:hypothetical protein
VGAGIFGVVSVLVIADLTRGTGWFNLTLDRSSRAASFTTSTFAQAFARDLIGFQRALRGHTRSTADDHPWYLDLECCQIA